MYILGRDVCPPVDDQPYNCRTCCCKSSENVDFFHPGAANQTVCGATESAKYKVSLVPTMNQICHPNYPGGVDSLYFSDLLVTSHHPFQLLDTCGGVARGSNVFDYLVRTEEVLTFIIDHLRERVIEGDIGDFYLSPDTLERGRRKRRVAIIEVLPRISYVTLISKLVCTPILPHYNSQSSFHCDIYSYLRVKTIVGWDSVGSTCVGQMAGRTG